MTAAVLKRGNLPSSIPEDDNRLIQERARQRLLGEFFRGSRHVPGITNEHAYLLFCGRLGVTLVQSPCHFPSILHATHGDGAAGIFILYGINIQGEFYSTVMIHAIFRSNYFRME